MKFRAWLMQQKDRDDPIGDLARDADSVRDAPNSDSKSTWQTYLRTRSASDAALEAFDEAHAEWSNTQIR